MLKLLTFLTIISEVATSSVFKNLAKFREKQLCPSLQLYLKGDSGTYTFP